MILLRGAAVTDCSCGFWVYCTFKLLFPVELSARICHFVVYIPCSWNSLCNVRCVRGNFACDYSLLYVVNIRQSKMFGRCNITKKTCSVHCGNRAADCRSNVVVARRNVGNKRSENIKRRSHTYCLLNFHICGNLIHWNVSRAFHHYLNIVLPCPFCKLSEADKLFYLADVGCVGKAARPACIAKAYSYIVLFANIKNFIIIFIKRIFVSCH